MIQSICIDLDDVLADTTTYALKWHGVPIESERGFPASCGYDITAAANKLLGYSRFNVKSFWNMLPEHFWSTIPKSDLCEWLITRCLSLVGAKNILILTSPTKDGGCHSGKYEWIVKNLPSELHRQYAISPRKHFCANSHTLLIDDSDRNCAEFRDRGGYFIRFPRPWNCDSHLVNFRLKTVEQRLKDFTYPCDI